MVREKLLQASDSIKGFPGPQWLSGGPPASLKHKRVNKSLSFTY